MSYRYGKEPLGGTISDYTDELLLLKVDETKWEKHWDRLVKNQHYLGFEGSFGGRVKYLIALGERIVGAIGFCAAVYRLGPRDAYIGLGEGERAAMLPHIINNNRFLILPGIRIRNLASRALSMAVRQVRTDWERQYGIVPVMVETFVDRERFTGACYKAANWTCLGATKGYGKTKQGLVWHGRKKDIYVYVIDRRLARRLKPPTGRAPGAKEEVLAMMNGTPMWYPGLLKDVGMTVCPAQRIAQAFASHLSRYMPYLGRSENKLHFVTMAQGLLSDLKRKSIEPIAVAFEGTDSVRNLTNFMSRGKWDDEAMLGEYRSELSALLSDGQGMITGDESGFPKKGNNSVGVARQYCGNTGKVDNCQVGVMAGYATTKGYGLIDCGLYMPKGWFDEDHKELRERCRVPSATSFKTKNEMLLEMICSAASSGLFPAKYVGVDSAFGSDPAFLDGLPDNLIYFAGVRKNCLVFAERPEVSVPAHSGRGRPPKQRAASLPLTVESLVDKSAEPWERVVLGIGAKGPIIAEDKCIRVVTSKGGLPDKDVWLYARRPADKAVRYALCNVSTDAPKSEVRKPALMRWSIEQCFKECKDYLGMDHYESRSWAGWHRHMLLALIAHLFIVKLRAELSLTPTSPNAAPHVEMPVALEEYLEAHLQMASGQRIGHPDISEMPTSPQQFMTIGLVQRLVSATFPKIGLVVEEVDYLLSKAASAFRSHSKAAVERALIQWADSPG
jgi:SRSO17 transposase